MTVASILATKGHEVISARNDSSMTEIIELLAGKRIGAVVIVDENDKVCGIISERDIVRDIGKLGQDILSHPVSECMTPDVVSCTEHNTINEVMEIMTAHRFRHLPVMENGQLRGLISIGDVVKRKIEQIEQEAEDIKSYIAST